MSGATRWQTFWRVTFALMLPITTSAFILSFIRGMEAFESAVFFGTPVNIKVLTTQIFDMITQRAQPDYQAATAMGFASLLLMGLLLLLQARVGGIRELGPQSTAKALARCRGCSSGPRVCCTSTR